MAWAHLLQAPPEILQDRLADFSESRVLVSSQVPMIFPLGVSPWITALRMRRTLPVFERVALASTVQEDRVHLTFLGWVAATLASGSRAPDRLLTLSLSLVNSPSTSVAGISATSSWLLSDLTRSSLYGATSLT